MDELKKLSNEDLLAEFVLVRQHLIELKFELFKAGKDKFTEKMMGIETFHLKDLYNEILRRMKWNYQETLFTRIVSM